MACSRTVNALSYVSVFFPFDSNSYYYARLIDDRLYSAILRSRADSLRLRVILHE